MTNLITHYFVCGVQHSGTSLLCEGLKKSGIAGVPDDHFLVWQDELILQKRFRNTNITFLDYLLEKGQTANGVIGCKILWHYFGDMLEQLNLGANHHKKVDFSTMDHLFQQPGYIWVVHRDKVQQAITWALASQKSVQLKNQLQKPEFDFTLIDNLRRLIEVGEQGWESFFERGGITPLTIVYEEMVDNYANTLKEMFSYLGLMPPTDVFIPQTGARKFCKTNRLLDEWRAHYWEIREFRSDERALSISG